MIRRFSSVVVLLALAAVSGCRGGHPNVLLVTFDTTRWDHVGYANGHQGVTPMLDALAKRGTWFSTCVTPQPLTLPSHASIMTGLYPFHHGVRNNGTYIVPDRDVTLAERFQAAGYATHAVVSAFVLDSRFGLDQGFDGYDDDLSGGPKQKMFMFKEIKAEQTAARAVEWLKGGRDKDRPFFLWVHFFDPHADYEPPPEWAAKFPGDPYTGEIAYADHSLGYILKELDDEHLLEGTVVAFTGDHGDGLGEHGENTHSLFIYESTTRVPLLFAGPGVPKGKRVDELVRTIDIAPTLLRLAGLEAADEVDGASLVPVWRGSPGPAHRLPGDVRPASQLRLVRAARHAGRHPQGDPRAAARSLRPRRRPGREPQSDGRCGGDAGAGPRADGAAELDRGGRSLHAR